MHTRLEPVKHLFQSTLSVRRATYDKKAEQKIIDISIHALREESDGILLSQVLGVVPISIHALREESDTA